MVGITLVAVLFALTLLAVWLFRGDALAPPCVTCATFTVSALFCIGGMRVWGGALHGRTIGVIAAGLLVYIVVSRLALDSRTTAGGPWRAVQQSQPPAMTAIPVSGTAVWVFLLFALLVVALYVREVRQIAAVYAPPGSWSETMQIYREVSSIRRFSWSAQVSLLLGWALQYILMAGHVFLYIAINNYLAGRGRYRRLVLLVVVIAALSLLRAERSNLVRYAISALVFWDVLQQKKTGAHRPLRMRLLARWLLYFGAILAVFVVSRSLVGRITQTDPFTYLCVYVGGPIQLLDLFLQQPSTALTWGRETFSGFLEFFYKYLQQPQFHPIAYPHQSSNGIGLGNAYTVFRPFIQDFGFAGALGAMALSAVIHARLYQRSKRFALEPEAPHTAWVLVYAFVCQTVFLQFYGHNFFSNICTVGALKNIVFLLVHYRLLLGGGKAPQASPASAGQRPGPREKLFSSG